jgi:hypothetical protein
VDFQQSSLKAWLIGRILSLYLDEKGKGKGKGKVVSVL